MSELRKFEMRIVNTADFLRYHPFWFIRAVPWIMILVVGTSGRKLISDPLDFWTWVSLLYACFIVSCRWFPGYIPQPKSRSLVLDDTTIRFPVKVFGTTEIPRAHVSEVSPMSSGLIIAWKKNGVPWYTELSEHSFDPTVWSEFREALMEWGNRKAEPVQSSQRAAP
jgi:hypothetical protein